MSPRYVRGVIASLLLHVVLVGAVLIVLPRSEVLPALFVDLTVEPRERVGTGATPRASAPAARPERRPDSPTGSTRSSDGAAARGPALPAPDIPEQVAPAPVAPAPELPPAPASAPAPPPSTAPDDATATAPPTTSTEQEPPSASAALPSASAKLDGTGPSAPPAGGGGALADVATHDDSGPRGPDAGSREGRDGGGTGQELARRSPGSEGGETPAVYTEYLARLRQRVHEALRYPPAARRRGLTGAVTIELTILPSGRIRDVSIVESSSHAILDDAAVETVRTLRAQPFPGNVPPRTLRVRLPVVFQLQ